MELMDDWKRRALEAERELAECRRQLAEEEIHPTCSGKWISGSGGHRMHDPCGAKADYFDEDDIYAYCLRHCPTDDRDRMSCVSRAVLDTELARREKELLRTAAQCGKSGIVAEAMGCNRHWEERNRELVRELDETRAFLRRTAMTGGSIVSSAAMTARQIAIARAADRMIVTPDGYGFVYIPGPRWGESAPPG